MYNTVCHNDYDTILLSLYESKLIKKSRKKFYCCECGDDIHKGSSYEMSTGLMYGDWCVFRTCLPCYHFRRDFFKEGWCFEGLREDFYNEYGFDYVGKWE